MERSRSVAFILLLLGILYGCTDSSTDKPIKDIDTLQQDTMPKVVKVDTVVVNEDPAKIYVLTQDDKTILDLLQTVEMGFSFNEVKAKYKVLKGIRPEDKKDDLAAAGFTESVCKQAIFGGEAAVEFNFKDDSLYSYSFSYNEKDSEKADKVFKAIKKYYSVYWGEAQPEMVEEENHYNQSFVWLNKAPLVIYINYNLNSNTIAWGRRFDKAL